MSCGCSNRTASRGGFTMIEVLVAASLTLLLVGLIFQFLVPALRAASGNTLETELQAMATLAMRGLVNDIEGTSVAGLSLLEDPPVLAIHPIVDVTQNNRRVYADTMVFYYYDAERLELVRREWSPGGLAGLDPPGQDQPTRLTQAELLAVPSATNGKERVVARQVSAFELGHSGQSHFVGQPVTVKLNLEAQSSAGEQRFELFRSIALRNQL